MFKSIKGYEGVYQMDNDGVIYSLDRCFKSKNGSSIKMKSKIRKPVNHCTGYMVIALCLNGNSKTYRYHRIVAETLIENPENKPDVNHKDGNKKNNHPSNLEWVTHLENVRHAVTTGLKSNYRGTNNPACRFSTKDVDDWVSLIVSGVKLKDIAEMYRCHPTSVSRLIKIQRPEILLKYQGNYKTRINSYSNK